ncbi:MAG: hypothetical protein AB7O24_29445 [Kofleriaceae bacterium]
MRHLTFAALLLSACTSREPEVGITFDPCSPLVITPAEGAAPHEVQSIRDAVAAWSLVLPVTIEVADPPQPDPRLPLRFESGDTFFRAIYWDDVGQIWVGRDQLAPENYAIAIAHELGHAFGLLHVPNEERPSVMNVGNLELVPNEQDARDVAALWDSCNAPAN